MKLRKPDPALMDKNKQTRNNQRASHQAKYFHDWRTNNRNRPSQISKPKHE